MGNIPDEFDSRDHPLFSLDKVQDLSSLKTASGGAPAKPFILTDLPPVYQQGNIGSCTANAVAAALRYAYKRKTGKKHEEFEPSRLFIYYNSRISPDPANLGKNEARLDIQTKIKNDTGSSNRTAIHSLLMQGVCKEELWPYGDPRSDSKTDLFIVDKPPNPCEPQDWAKAAWQAKGSSHPKDPKDLSGQPDMIPRAISYYRIFDPKVKPALDPVTNLPETGWQIISNHPPVVLLENCLSGGFPFIFGCQLFKGAGLNNGEIDEGGVFKKPPTGNFEKDGRHAMMAVGFDAARRLFLIQNSWGKEWPKGCKDEKMKGRFWMPYEWFEVLVNGLPITYDFWVIKYSVTK